MERSRCGRRSSSPVIEELTTEDFNKVFKPNRSPSDWLSRDEQEVDKYIADPLCGFPCTTQLWADLLDGIVTFSQPSRQLQIRKDIPLFVFIGALDPVGKQSAGVKNLSVMLMSTQVERCQLQTLSQRQA